MILVFFLIFYADMKKIISMHATFWNITNLTSEDLKINTLLIRQ